MDTKPKFLIVLSVIVLIGLIFWAFMLQSLPDKSTVWNYLFNSGIGIAYLTAGITGVFLGKKLSWQPKIGRSLSFMGLGISAYGIGWIIWTYYNLILKVEIPVPSVADIFFIILFIPLTAYGLGQVIAHLSQTIESKHILIGLAVFFASFLSIFGFVMAPEISADLTTIQNITNSAYPVSDSILLALSLIIVMAGVGKKNSGFMVLALAFLLQVVADIFYSYRVAGGLYWNGDIADALYSLPSFLITISFVKIYLGEVSSLANK